MVRILSFGFFSDWDLASLFMKKKEIWIPSQLVSIPWYNSLCLKLSFNFVRMRSDPSFENRSVSKEWSPHTRFQVLLMIWWSSDWILCIQRVFEAGPMWECFGSLCIRCSLGRVCVEWTRWKVSVAKNGLRIVKIG